MSRLRALLDGGGRAQVLARLPVRLRDRLRARLADVAGSYGLRVEPGRRAALAMAVAAVVAAAVAGWWVLQARPHSTPLTTDTAMASASGASASTGPEPPPGAPLSSAPRAGSSLTPVGNSPAAELVVDVAGKVAKPGIYRLAQGTRVADAVQAAGGALPGTDLTSLNLARKLSDGEQIAVGVAGAADAGPAADGATGASAAGPVNLNSATLAQLDALPGLGPALAQRVLDWRGEHGRFASVDQLREVSGIGEAKFATLRPLVTV